MLEKMINQKGAQYFKFGFAMYLDSLDVFELAVWYWDDVPF